jgi:hypothetical protein
LRCKEGSTTYQYKARVRPFDKGQNYGEWTSYTADTSPTIPVPDNIAFVGSGGGDVQCNWTNKDPWLIWTQLADESDLREYEVRYTADGNAPEVAEWGTGGTEFIYRGKDSKHKVTDWEKHISASPASFWIKAKSKQDIWSATAGTIVLTINTPTMAGFTPTVQQMRPRAIKVIWKDWTGYGGDNVKEYEVWYSTNAAFNCGDADAVSHKASGGTYTVTGLTRKLTYYIRLRPIGWLATGTQSSIG